MYCKYYTFISCAGMVQDIGIGHGIPYALVWAHASIFARLRPLSLVLFWLLSCVHTVNVWPPLLIVPVITRG